MWTSTFAWPPLHVYFFLTPFPSMSTSSWPPSPPCLLLLDPFPSMSTSSWPPSPPCLLLLDPLPLHVYFLTPFPSMSTYLCPPSPPCLLILEPLPLPLHVHFFLTPSPHSCGRLLWMTPKTCQNLDFKNAFYEKRRSNPIFSLCPRNLDLWLEKSIYVIQSDLCYPRNSIICGFWGQNLVRTTYMNYSKTSIIHTSIIRGFCDKNTVRPSTADNRGINVYEKKEKQSWFMPISSHDATKFGFEDAKNLK